MKIKFSVSYNVTRKKNTNDVMTKLEYNSFMYWFV